MQEIFKPIEGYDNYLISNYGYVLNTKFNRKVLGRYAAKNKLSYSVSLCKNSLCKNHLLNRLVAKAFIPNPKEKPEVNHIDNNPSNNHVSNLEWVTGKENMAHASRQGRLMRVFTDDILKDILSNRKISSEYYSKLYGISGSTIRRVRRGELLKEYINNNLHLSYLK